MHVLLYIQGHESWSELILKNRFEITEIDHITRLHWFRMNAVSMRPSFSLIIQACF